ncbi:MAG: YggS family pyridoxal phosphate-dependent enzyme [Planctomycetia bacterium]|nr:YggS family pyridoxal phosphate-dependent enzyme [Planctomycetia bacterium]
MNGDDVARRVRGNLAAVRERIAAACRTAGRDPADVRLVGVTKYVSASLAGLLLEAGCTDLAESRPQSLWAKAAALAGHGPPPRWHLVGHLQRNKIRRTLPLTTLLHSLDSLRLLEALEQEAAAAGIVRDALVEVNLAGDPGRTGLMEADVAAVIEAAATTPHVRIVGLMGMAAVPVDADAGAAARRQFGRLRAVRDDLAARLPAAAGVVELSMGMSGDFEEAILEGATLVRVGSALWEGVGDGVGG